MLFPLQRERALSYNVPRGEEGKMLFPLERKLCYNIKTIKSRRPGVEIVKITLYNYAI